MLPQVLLSAATLLATVGIAGAQTPLIAPNPSPPPQTIPAPQPLPPAPASPAPDIGRPAPPFSTAPPSPPVSRAEAPQEQLQPAPEIARVFCDQQVTYHIADEQAVPPPYRKFLGIWSDAAWTPQLCAALIVQGVQPDGTAAIVYAYGPMGSAGKGQGGVLRGTGVIRDGELRFQNNDGSQFSFKPYFADLDGHLTTPKGQNYQAIFKKTY